MPRHVRKGDTVMITAGDQRGKVGEIKRVIPKSDRVIVQGVNLRTKHLKPTRLNPQGGIITKEAPIHISNVSPVVDGRPGRVRFKTRDDGSKLRVSATKDEKTIGREIHGPRKK
ncbi:MAG: 50S ribosomal protein L24 [Planctomycetes bacterium]|nr:50S ribosomal protein L24 [Planctomycetota bacterium]